MLKILFSVFETISNTYFQKSSILKKYDRIAPLSYQSIKKRNSINEQNYLETYSFRDSNIKLEDNKPDDNFETPTGIINIEDEINIEDVINIEDETLIIQKYLQHLEDKVLNSELSSQIDYNSDDEDYNFDINNQNVIGKLSECTYSNPGNARANWRKRNSNKINYYYFHNFNLTNRIDYLKNQMKRIASTALNIYTEAENSVCDIFISYKQNDNSDALVINMHYSMKENKINAWLDKMRGDERSESGMVAGVKSCRLFCAVISPYYFKSKFCLLELQTAIRMSKKLVICFNGSKFKIQEALSWIPEEYLFLKNDELIKLDEDNEYMQIGLDKVIKRL